MYLAALILVIPVLLCLLYAYCELKYKYWRKRNVPSPKPTLLFGNILRSLLMKVHLGDLWTEIYKQYKDAKYVGCYIFTKPAIMIRDPDLIKTILTSDFNHFMQNEMEIDKKVDPIRGRCPFAQYGDDWKDERKRLSSNYSLTRIRANYPIIKASGESVTKYIEKQRLAGKSFNAYELAIRYTIDLILPYGLGINANVFENDNDEFLKIARGGRDANSYISGLSGLLIQVASTFTNAFKIKKYDDDTIKFYNTFVSDIVKYRKDNNIIRNDFLTALVDYTKTEENFHFIDVMAQIAGFFDDAVGNTSLVKAFMLHELAMHPHVQNKLREEIHAVRKRDGEISYDELNKMKYLEAVINETIRLHNPDPQLMKRCTKKYELPGDLTVDPGTTIIIPINAIHRDDAYFDNPLKFDPERWMDDHEPRNPNAFLPFGLGPRKCIGMPLALIQFKVYLCSILENYHLEVVANEACDVAQLKTDPKVLYRCPNAPVILNAIKV